MKDPGQLEYRPRPNDGWLTRESARVLVVLMATALVIYLCFRLALPFVPAITWALTLAVVTHPLHQRIERRVRRRNIAAGLSVAIVAVLIIAPGLWLIQHLAAEATRGVESIRAQMESGGWRKSIESNTHLARVIGWIEQHLDIQAVTEQAGNAVAPYLSSLAAGSAWALALLLITLLTLFYLLRDRREILRVTKSQMPLSRSETDSLFSRVNDTIYATVYGTFVVSAIQGTLGGLMFWWLGLPAPLFWGVVMTLLALIPVLGAPVVWVPAAIYLALIGSWGKALILTGWGAAVMGSIDNLLFPILVGNRLRMHPLLVFFSVVGGLILFGVSGVILGPAVVVIASELMELWREHTPREANGA